MSHMEEGSPSAVPLLLSDVSAENVEAGRDARVLRKIRKRKRIVALISAFVLIVAVVFCIGYFVIGKRIAQRCIDGAKMELEGTVLKPPSESQDHRLYRFGAELSVKLSKFHMMKGVRGKIEPAVWKLGYNGTDVALLNAAAIKVSEATTKFKMNVTVDVTNRTAFAHLARDLVRMNLTTWRVRTSASISAKIWGFFPIHYSNLHFDKTLTVRGFGGLESGMKLLGFDVVSGKLPRQYNVEANVSIYNPAIVNISNCGDVKFEFMYRKKKMGSGILPSMSLIAGWNNLSISCALEPDEVDAGTGSDLISAYFNNWSATVSAHAVNDTMQVFKDFVGAMTLSLDVPKSKAHLVERVIIDGFGALHTLRSARSRLTTMREFSSFPMTLPVQLVLYNMFRAPVTVNAINMSAFLFEADTGDPVVVGGQTAGPGSRYLPITIPGKSSCASLRVPVTINVTSRDALDILTEFLVVLMKGDAFIGLNGTTTLDMAPTKLSPFFTEPMIPACMENSKFCGTTPSVCRVGR